MQPKHARTCSNAAGAVPAPDEEKKGMGETLVLGGLFGLWYLFNIYFNMWALPPFSWHYSHARMFMHASLCAAS